MNVTGKPKSAGFTLVELLVVIAIVATLAAVSLAVIPKMLKKGKATESLQNLRQIGALLNTYATDHQSQLPPINGEVTLVDGTKKTLQWNVTCLTQLYPDMEVAKFEDATWWKAQKTILKNPLFKGSVPLKPGYAMNLMLPGNIAEVADEPRPSEADALQATVALASIREPERTPLCMPFNDYIYSLDKAEAAEAYKTAPLNEMTVDDKVPVLFFDGHVDSLTPAEYVSRKLYEFPRAQTP